MTQFHAAALSDIGRVRSENEDRYLLDVAKGYLGVADGVGGLPGGAEAAQCTLDEIIAGLNRQEQATTLDLIEIVHQANAAVQDLGLRLSPDTGIGSTLTFGVIREDHLHLAHVGDSRAYLWRNDEFIPLTNDHSVENEARMRRARGERFFFHEVNRNALTRCMGQPTPPEVDLASRRLHPGDRLLFCTDGITRLIGDVELGALLGQPGDPETLLRTIVTLAIQRGGPDNATGVLAFIDPTN